MLQEPLDAISEEIRWVRFNSAPQNLGFSEELSSPLSPKVGEVPRRCPLRPVCPPALRVSGGPEACLGHTRTATPLSRACVQSGRRPVTVRRTRQSCCSDSSRHVSPGRGARPCLCAEHAGLGGKAGVNGTASHRRWIQEEKESSEQRAEETDSRAGGARLGSLRRFKSLSSLNLCPASSLAGSCPPSRERSPPRGRQHSPELQGDRLDVLTPLPALMEEEEDDETSIKGGTSSPASPRSLRLDRLHTGALRGAGPEDVRDARNSTGSQDGPGGNPSSSTISQDSLHKAAKKKGIRSCIGRLFGKK
ncbi:liprin-alpha-1-like [Dama dama]|uniref:liprin-alpha-1-like n=1 Tax=Dama dama TaxID=30532 RepID=UPI002A360132|nr:liprin-alpha-1-like [Dama dama]